MKTTIEQHQGTHEATGLRITQLVDVTTDPIDYEPDFATLAPGDREYVDEQIATLHRLRVRIASLDADQRDDATRRIAERAPSDIDDQIATMRAALAKAEF